MCAEYGYYEVSRGYRKIPGNICTGGVQLSPIRYDCSMSGKLVKYLSFSGILTLCIILAICYFGWPIIEGIIILLPLPDPKILKQQLGSLLIKFKAILASIPALFKSGNAQSGAPAGYRQDFELAPGSLAEEDDEEDLDIGK